MRCLSIEKKHKHIINYNLCICQITYKCTSPRLQIDTSNKRLVSKLKTIFPNTNNNPLWSHCEGGDLPAGVVAHVLHWILRGIDGIGEVSGLGTNWFGMVGWIYKGWLSDKFCIIFFWCNIPLKTRVFAVNLKFTVLMDSVCIRGSRPGWWIDIVGVSGVWTSWGLVIVQPAQPGTWLWRLCPELWQVWLLRFDSFRSRADGIGDVKIISALKLKLWLDWFTNLHLGAPHCRWMVQH